MRSATIRESLGLITRDVARRYELRGSRLLRCWWLPHDWACRLLARRTARHYAHYLSTLTWHEREFVTRINETQELEL